MCSQCVWTKKQTGERLLQETISFCVRNASVEVKKDKKLRKDGGDDNDTKVAT